MKNLTQALKAILAACDDDAQALVTIDGESAKVNYIGLRKFEKASDVIYIDLSKNFKNE